MHFAPGLSVALIVPAVAALMILGALFADVFSPRSPNPLLRNPRNLALTGLGVVAVLPFLVVYVLALYG